MAPVPQRSGAEWPSWLRGGAVRGCGVPDDALEAPVFNAAADGRTGGQFWLSSLLNEAVVQGADAAYAAGTEYDLGADVAADVISNHLAVLTSPTWAARRAELPAARCRRNVALARHRLRGAARVVHRTRPIRRALATRIRPG